MSLDLTDAELATAQGRCLPVDPAKFRSRNSIADQAHRQRDTKDAENEDHEAIHGAE
jgi:hypothetical protein